MRHPLSTRDKYSSEVLRRRNQETVVNKTEPSPILQSVTETLESNTLNEKNCKKRVSFGNVHIQTFRCRNLSKSQRKSLWFSKKDVRTLRTKVCALDMSVRTGQGQEFYDEFEASDTWRGLEHARQGRFMEKLQNRENFTKMFLSFQNDMRVRDPDALRLYSANNSREDRKRALELGTQDALDACQIYYDFLTAAGRPVPFADVRNKEEEEEAKVEPPIIRERQNGASRYRKGDERSLVAAPRWHLTLSF